MDRRRFIVTSISAAAVATALATDACSSGRSVGNGSLFPGSQIGSIAGRAAGPSYELTVQYATTDIRGYKLRGRTYNGKTVGPMLTVRPGETLSLKVVNKLPPNIQARVPRGSVPIPRVRDDMVAMEPVPRVPNTPSGPIDPMNNPHNFNTTNMHTHGLQTVPHLFDPIGTSNPSAEMIAIDPGQSFQYNFPIPADHPSGLHWYHPHSHGSTDVQVSNGMAGLIVVRGPIDEVPEIKAAREVFLVVQSLGVNKSKTDPGIYEREYIPYRTPANGGYSFGTTYTMFTTNGVGICWLDNSNPKSPVYKPLGMPTFVVAPGEVFRLRLLNGCNALPLCLALPGFQAWQIGFDGVNTLVPIPKDLSGDVSLVTMENVFQSPVRLAMPANRIEFLMRAPSEPGTYTLSTIANSGIHFDNPTMALVRVVVSGKPVTMSIPETLPEPTREYPVITEKDVVKKRKFVFDEGPRTDLLMGFGFTINDQLYQEDQCPTAPQVGTCEEWRLENATTDGHPFHLHENSFQLIAVNDEPNEPMEVWDTFIIPPKVGGKNGSITFRVRFLQWYGKTVFHCHILPHEDTGMMQNILMA